MSDKFEKLVEGLFAQEENVLGSRELEKLLFLEYKKKLNEKGEQKERVLKLPRLQISENWGKAKSVERSELERIVDTATRGQKNVFDRLKIIQQQMTSLSSGQLGKIKNPRRILSQIILLETMNRLFKSFQPAPAGFINEALLSVFYGGEQTSAGAANKAKDIGDVTDPDGIPISIKTKGSGGLIVDGSIENLYESINRAGKVYFDIYEKITEGGGKDKHVGTLKVSRFVVDANNINQFLGKDYFTLQNGKLIPKAQFKKGGKDISDNEELSEAKEKRLSNIELVPKIVGATAPIPKEELEKMTSHLGPVVFDRLVKVVKKSKVFTDDPKVKDIITKNVASLASIQISRREIEKTSGGLEREFSRTEVQWRPFADQTGVDEITISFSDKQINDALQAAVQQLDQQIVQIFNNLDGFSQSISAYLTSIASNRAQEGMKALEYAKQLEPQTQKVVKTVSGDEQDENI
jgi:hypothetical protein